MKRQRSIKEYAIYGDVFTLRDGTEVQAPKWSADEQIMVKEFWWKGWARAWVVDNAGGFVDNRSSEQVSFAVWWATMCVEERMECGNERTY